MEATKRQRAKPDDKSNREDCKCGACLKAVLEQDNGVMCEICNNWYHCKCQGIADHLYQILNQYGAELHWFCKRCQVGADKLLALLTRMQTKVDKLEEEISRTRSDIRVEMNNSIQQLTADLDKLSRRCDENDKKVDECKSEMNITENTKSMFESQILSNKCELQEMQKKMQEVDVKLQMVQDDIHQHSESPLWSDVVQQVVDSKFEGVQSNLTNVEKSIEETRKKALELNDKEERRNNIILYKVPESVPGNYEEVIAHDRDFFLEVCTEALGVDITQDDIKKIYRIGKRGPNARPLLIRLSSGTLKNHVMQMAYKLRAVEKFKEVVISHDLTKQERDNCKRLVANAKEQESQDTSGEFIYRVRGPPGEMRIVKLPKRT